VSKIYVIGIGYKPLDKRARDIILGAEVILASERLSEVFRSYKEFEMVGDAVRVINNIDETINCIKSALSGLRPATIAVIASGDPLFFGIGRRIVEEFGREIVEILPDLSSIQIAFARIKEPWDNAFLMSIHGGPDPKRTRRLPNKLEDIPSLLTLHDKIAILTDKVNNPSAIAKEVLRSSNASLRSTALTMYVCEKLGYPEETIIKGIPEEIAGRTFSDPNVVIIMRRREPKGNGQKVRDNAQEATDNEHEGYPSASRLSPFAPSCTFGLTEKEIHHSRGLITKDEIRAVTIHKLRLPQKGVFWDVGAGSGSVSLEAVRLCPGLEIFAIEKDEEQIRNIRTNCERFDAKNIEILHGKAPEVLEGLPSPGRVFIGGSGGRLDEIIGLVKRGMPSGIVVVNATTIETLQEAITCLEKSGFEVEISEVSVSKSKVIAGKKHMNALNPVFIVTGEKGV
jgi:precorrin-6Y C5,15-methyltransferase (decarboxylating)